MSARTEFDSDWLAQYQQRAKSWKNPHQNRDVATQSTLRENTTCGTGEILDPENGQLEGKLQQRIEKELKRRGWLFFHDRSRGMNAPGLPDLLIWAPGGRHILMELKKKGGKGERGGSMSDDQKRFAARALWLGFEWHLVRSFKQAVGILDGNGKDVTP